MRVMAPDRAVVQVDGVSGRRYAARGGVYEMSDRDACALVTVGGFIPSLTGHTARSIGFACNACGFRSFFKTCSRCGGECQKEGHHATS